MRLTAVLIPLLFIAGSMTGCPDRDSDSSTLAESDFEVESYELTDSNEGSEEELDIAKSDAEGDITVEEDILEEDKGDAE